MKTVRFTQLVEKSGSPEPYTLWSAPQQDEHFQKAVQQDRVLTVHLESTGAKKDYGEIGFTKDRKGSLLIFPKSLKSFTGRRVVGINYDLLESPTSTPAAPSKVSSTKPAGERSIAEAPKAKPSKARSTKAKDFPPLRVLQPAPSSAPKKPVREAPKKKAKAAPRPSFRPAKTASPSSPSDPASEQLFILRREVVRAMKALAQGKAVAAYQRLEKAME